MLGNENQYNMEIKKTPKADLENKKFLFREIGLILTLCIVYIAFEWKTYETQIAELSAETIAPITEEEMIPITTKEPPAQIEAPKQPDVSDFIDIVSDEVVVEDDILISTEDNASLGVDIKDYVEEVVEEEIVEEIPFAIVEDKPSFNGGDPTTEFQKWVYSKIEYPEIARENGIQGRVYLSFVVDVDGTVKNIKVLRGVDPTLDKEAVNVISKSPKWIPGKQRNKPVRVTYTFFINFQLR